ncbi:carboxylesterase [Humibacillus sp. DSM 29435]|uniref:carboxylesterase/lipase family protein n=1 Tax=Humibacillus sp. DSM 29435 TaxID=1869167 RepID=UPI000872322E|nr:carboxylesterase family protein [Humibacillus sp. DSM 29435]OFE16724.1 carboxylesterase [Humibacillus sp. DSM 29435]
MGPVVAVSGGQVIGTSHAGVNVFLGIPYAAPAVGRSRYREPQPVVPWPGRRDATSHGPTPAQTPYPAPMDEVLPSSVTPGDDYLNLSVWAPSEGENLPVMVWIHGGAFVRGANSISTYDGSAFARDGVVMVGVNYRLGAPGFAVLDGAPTNLGLRDQIAALTWVRENVAAFGGNPDNVTLFGESAGAMSVATLMTSPGAQGLFHRAIAQSGAATVACSLDDARLVSGELAAQLGVPATAEAFAELDPDDVLAAQTAVALAIQADPNPQRWGASILQGGLGIMSLFPVIDGDVVPEVPQAGIAHCTAAGMPLLLGTTRQEYRLFLVSTGLADAVSTEMLPALAARYGWPDQAVETYTANRPSASAGDIAGAILTDAAFRVPTTALAAAQHASGGTVYTYEFAWPTPVMGLGACHALELGFVFDTLGEGSAMAGANAPQPLADEMHRAWVAFARDGDPGWTAWTPDDPAVMTFDCESEVVYGPRADELALWPIG